MSNHSVVAQLLAKNPRSQARFPDVPVDQALREFEQLQQKISPPAPAQPAAAPASGGEMAAALNGSVAAIVTNLWRAKMKMVEPGTNEPKEDTRRIYRHVEGALETFTQLGLTITEMVNQPYDAGLPVKVLTFQPTPGLKRDTILEVVRPTIIWQDTLLQMGEIVVGIPAESPNKNA
ncbi:MAG TPA: hypothetical protein VHO24_16610 [Opitutaceae bacterium]|nr:hypothetical protein [Opitutaceae bacterium]